VVTDRDRSVVAWVAVIGAVSAQDVMARFRVGRIVAYRRLARLVGEGTRTRTRTREFIVHPDTIERLPTGTAAVTSPGEGEPRIARMHHPEGAR